MKIYTYYEDINFKVQNPLVDIWQKSWENQGFEAIVLGRADAEKHDFYGEFVSRLEKLHLDIIEKPIPQKQQTKPLFEGVGALSDVLNQTHAEGGWRDMGSMTARDAVSFKGGMPGQETKVVDSVNDMVAGQRTSDINQVSIDSVPDFSGLMSNLKNNGKL